MSLYCCDELVPAHVDQEEHGHNDKANAHHNELQKICDQHGKHSAEDRVNSHTDEQDGHGKFKILHVESAHDHQELAARSQEHAHVEQASEDDDDSRSPSN